MSRLFRALAVLLAICGLAFIGGPAPAAEPETNAAGPAAAAPNMAAVLRRIEEMTARRREEIKAKLAELHIEPRTVETLPEQGVHIRKLIKSGDFAGAHQTLADVVAHSKLTPWAYYPFSGVLVGIVAAQDPDLEKRLSEWVTKAPNDPLPLIIRADLYRDIAWSKRGENSVGETSANQMAGFEDYSARAFADINAAIKLDPENPTGYMLKLQILNGQGFSEALATAFTDAIAKFPNYLTLYQLTLEALQPKWGGSVKAMYRFVDSYAGKAPDDSPLKLLYLFLYAHLLNDAAASCSDQYPDQDKVKSCIAIYMDANVTADLKKQTSNTLKLYDHLDHFWFGARLRDAFFEMLHIDGAEAYSGAMLQQAAEAMHSDTETDAKLAHPSDYIIDELVAESYRDSPGIATTKLKQALNDIDKTKFENEVDKDTELSYIYDKIAALYDQSLDPSLDLHCTDENAVICGKINAIAQETAARMLNKSTEHQNLICDDDQLLRLFEEAVKSCTDVIDYDGNMKAVSMRGQTYIMLHQWEPALHDLTIVADSDSDQRIYAQMGIVTLHMAQNDYQSAVKTLNKYPSLFDPDIVGTSFVFTSFNNRCLAYMLQKALNDCTEALKYTWSQSTYQMQQELQQKLGKH